MILTSICVGLAACGPQPKKERIGGASSKLAAPAEPGSQLTKAQAIQIEKLFSVDAITELQMNISHADNGLLENPKAVEKASKEFFKDLLSLTVVKKVDPKDKKNDEKDDEPTVSQKPQNKIWEDLKIIEVKAIEDQGAFEGISMKIGLADEEIELSGGFRTKNRLKASWDNGRTAFLSDKSDVESGIEALSSCMSTDCGVILSVIRLDEINFKVIVTSSNKIKKLASSGPQSKKLISGSADIHRIIGANQEQIIFYLNYDQTNDRTEKVYSRASVQNTLDITEEIFYVNSPLETTKVSVAVESGKKVVRIFNNLNTSDDDLYLEILAN